WRAGCSRGARGKYGQGLEVRVRRHGGERGEMSSVRQSLEVVSPSGAMFIHELEDRASDRLVAAKRRNDLIGAQVSERGCSHQVGAVGERGAEKRREIAIADGELLCQIVIERDL